MSEGHVVKGRSGRLLSPETRRLVALLRSARQVSVTCSLTVSGASLAGRSWEFMAQLHHHCHSPPGILGWIGRKLMEQFCFSQKEENKTPFCVIHD